MKKSAHICLGSNWSDAGQELTRALAAISTMPGVTMLALSGVYLTEPQEYGNQPWFHNQVCKLELEQNWTAEKFLQALLEVETGLGRVRSPDPALRFGPRRIDLDLLLFDGEKIRTPSCEVPHPRLCRRAFALLPLQEIEPDITINNHPISHWLNKLRWKLRGNLIFQENAGE